jgi:hypothetical protein
LLRWVAGFYLSYLLLSLLVVLPVLNIGAPILSERLLQRELRTELILFNPFTLAVEVRKASLSEHQQPDAVFAGFDRLEVNLSTASLWQTGWVLDAALLEGFHAHLRRTGSDAFNISDLITSEEDAGEDPEPAEIPGVTIEELALHAKRLQVTDETRDPVYQTHWDDLAIAATDLSTVREAGQPYQLSATAEAGGRLEWEGDVSIPGAYSEGRISLSNVQLRTAWRFAEPWLAFELASGALGMSGAYRIDWGDAMVWTLSGAQVSIDTVDVAPKEPGAIPDTHARLGGIAVSGISVDSTTQSVDVAQITVNNIDIAGFSEGTDVSLVDMFAVSLPEDVAELGAEAEAAAAAAAEPWRVKVASVTGTGGQLDWGSEFTDPGTTRIREFVFNAGGITWPAEGPADIGLSFTLNERASLEVAGKLHPGDGTGEFQYTLDDLPLEWFSPNLPDALNADVSGGPVTTTGSASLADFAPTQVVLDGEVGKLQIIIHEETDAISGWESFRWKNLILDIPQQAVTAEALFLDRYQGRLHIREDGTINSQRLLQEEAAENGAASEEPEESAKPWQVSLPSILISKSALDFKDESLPLEFQTVVGNLNGDITGFSTAPDSQMTVDLKGTVDGYAPVVLAGTAQPFREMPALDMGLSFEGIDLVLLTPYSGTYAGYAIERGLLNLDLKYSLADNRLQGDNRVVVDQLKLGERVDSEQAVDLPIELALALLTDANGVIDLEVPVSGNLEDPEFSLGSVIGKAFLNLITKAVTAPFNLLASLVGSEENLERVTYPAGSASLDERGQLKLSQLAEAMAQRPELTLVIEGRFNPKSDRNSLRMRELEQQFLSEGLTADDIERRTDAWVDAMERRYAALGLSPAEPPSLAQKGDAVLASIPVSDDALADLALQRATEAKTYLVNEAGVEADRAVIDSVDPADEANRISGIEFSIDT